MTVPLLGTAPSGLAPSSLFKRRTIKLTFAGDRTEDGIHSVWKTTFTLKRVMR